MHRRSLDMSPVLLMSTLALLALPVVAAAQGSRAPAPRPAVVMHLPPELVYRRGVGQDSAVVFDHVTHVEFAANRCTGCHPKPFPLLRRGPFPTHALMMAGGSCGICHDGRKAFGIRDSLQCRTCHSGLHPREANVSAAAPKSRLVPGPHVFPRGADSPGPVTFRHETHAAQGCATCHPQLFAMAAAPPRPGGGMHESSACGSCHDGSRAFAAQDAASCARCHAGAGEAP
jgi:c(7)-type cytochrome triheme protein